MSVYMRFDYLRNVGDIELLCGEENSWLGELDGKKRQTYFFPRLELYNPQYFN